MTVGLLSDIIEKVRNVSASGNSDQVSDEKIVKYLNSYYLYDFPDDLRLLKLKDTYVFNTIQGVDVYPFDFDSWSTIEGPAYVSKEQVTIYQDVKSYNNWTAYTQSNESFATGDGTEGPYSGNTISYPIRRSVWNNPMVDTQTAGVASFPTGYPPTFNESNISRIQNILITSNTATSTQNVTDDGDGNLIGDCAAGGTIDYFTGAISGLTFDNPVPSGNDIWVQYVQTTFARPTSIFFYQNQFILNSVPDQGYTVEVQAYREPSKALMGTTSTTAFDLNGRPEEFGWWELLAFGTAKKLYQDRLDMDGVQMMQVFIDEQVSQARTKTYGQLASRSINTMFRDAQNQLNWE